jgi:hypothetical protein
MKIGSVRDCLRLEENAKEMPLVPERVAIVCKLLLRNHLHSTCCKKATRQSRPRSCQDDGNPCHYEYIFPAPDKLFLPVPDPVVGRFVSQLAIVASRRPRLRGDFQALARAVTIADTDCDSFFVFFR